MISFSMIMQVRMMKVFVAGPRAVTTLDPVVIDRLSGLTKKGATVLVGDADGVDSLAQKCFADLGYRDVIVYASNGRARNNLGNWDIRSVPVGEKTKGFAFYASKDLQMAEDTDFGFMIWNGHSKGTLNNMVNLIRRNKVVLVYLLPQNRFYGIGSMGELHELVGMCGVYAGKRLKALTDEPPSPRSEQISFEAFE